MEGFKEEIWVKSVKIYIINLQNWKGWGWVCWCVPVIWTTWELEIGRITVQGQPRKKVNETLSKQNKLDVVVCSYNPSYVGGVGQSRDPQLKTKSVCGDLGGSGC
jgi:hypothetical protein